MVSADIPAELSNLPLEYMISAPMNGAIKAQALAAKTTADFIQNIGFQKDSGGKLTATSVDFSYKSPPPITVGQTTPYEKKLSVPLLSILPIPYLRIKDMTIDFDFKINTTATESAESTTSTNVNASAKWWFVDVSVNGTYTTKNDSSSSVTRTAEMRVVVNAAQDEMPGGLRTVLNILQQSILEQSQGSGGSKGGDSGKKE